MGMRPDDFWDCTTREFFAKMKGYQERELLRERSDWERTRWATWVLLNIQLGKENKISLEELLPFEWEKKEAKEPVKPLTIEELEEIKRMYDGG